MVEIKKGGKLIQTEVECSQEQDVTDSAVRFLFDYCTLEDGVTIRDIFLLLNSELELFDLVLGNWTKEIVNEGLSQPGKPYDLSDEEAIEYLELYWSVSYDESTPELNGINRPEFHGVGVAQKEDKVFEWGGLEHKKGERTRWAVDLSPVSDLVNIPVKLNTDFVVFDDDPKHETDMDQQVGFGFPIGTYKGANFTLGNILEGIIWELSFHGEPAQRNAMIQELRRRVEETKNAPDLHTRPFDGDDEVHHKYPEDQGHRKV